MLGANQALSFIVFKRDLKTFESRYESLKVEKAEPLRQGLRYLLSGGLNFRKLAPSAMFRLLKHLEHSKRIPKFFAIHWMVVLRKT